MSRSLLALILITALCAPTSAQAAVVTFLTSGTSYSTPVDWNNSDNSIECIGAGGNGGQNNLSGGGGGGGGGYFGEDDGFGGCLTNGSDGGAGGNFGGGGGGGGPRGVALCLAGSGGVGSQGIITVTYTPASAPQSSISGRLKILPFGSLKITGGGLKIR